MAVKKMSTFPRLLQSEKDCVLLKALAVWSKLDIRTVWRREGFSKTSKIIVPVNINKNSENLRITICKSKLVLDILLKGKNCFLENLDVLKLIVKVTSISLIKITSCM